MADQKITDFPVLSQGGVDVLNDVIPIVDVNLDLNKKITPASIVGAVLPNPGPIGASTPNTGDFTDVTIDNLTVTGSFVYNIDANDLTGTTLASNVINSSLENTKPATGKFVVGDPLINGNSHLEINGGDTGSGDGAYITIQNDGTDIIAIGNKSAIVGGSYNASPYVYATTTIEFSQNLNLAAGTTNGVAYLNGSKVLTTGTGLQFDGMNLGVGVSAPIHRLSVGGPTGNGISYNDGTVISYQGTTGSNKVLMGSLTNHPVDIISNIATIASFSSSGVAVTSGNLGIGYSTFSNATGASGRKIIVGDAATSATPAAITVYSGAATYGGVYFADGWTGDQAYRGYVEYNHATDTLSASAAGGAGGWSLSASGFNVTGIQTITANSSSAALTVTQSGAGPVLNLSGLPTSAAGLSAGDIWNDSGTLKVV